MQRLEELAPGVFRFAVPGVIRLNAGIVVGDQAVCVIESGTLPDEAAAILAAARTVSDLPVRYVVNTHFHGDHTFGNHWMRPALIVGHERCRLRLLGDAGSSHREMFATLIPPAAAEIRTIPVTPPDATFAEGCVLELGERRLTLRYDGRAHTDNDISIQAGDVVFAGDVIEESGPPIVDDGFPAEWGPTLRRLLARTSAATQFVPGHGRVVGEEFVDRQARAFEDLAAAWTSVDPDAEAAQIRDALRNETVDVLEHHADAAIARLVATEGAAAPEEG